jgi:RNA ligase
MNYSFPIINTIDDVLPAIKDRDEFIVSDKSDFIVCNYVVSEDKTFSLEDSTNYGEIRRECRGLKFYPDGRIMSRPYHKFFNVNEKEETQSHLIDLSRGHKITKKLDGSMIHPVVMKNGSIRWATKMGITDVAMNAEIFIAKNPNYQQFAQYCIEHNLTPIFEWLSPKNQIVIHYSEDNLILLAIRHNITGTYISLDYSS